MVAILYLFYLYFMSGVSCYVFYLFFCAALWSTVAVLKVLYKKK